jgi:glutamate synthase (NADPH/NADH) large chain
MRKRRPERMGLYDPAFEHEACGVGFVARLSGVPEREILDKARTVLERMSHRGAAVDGQSGDGAGILLGAPQDFLRKAAAAEDIGLGARFAAGLVFLPLESERQQLAVELMEQQAQQFKLQIRGWRAVPVDPVVLGPLAVSCQPVITMVFLENYGGDFTRNLYLYRKSLSSQIHGSPAIDPDRIFHIPSLSPDILVYKGMHTPDQLFPYFLDLLDEDMKTHMAVVHSRFSTNTFPSWDRAQPLRMVAHNGEFNTLKGNVNRMRAREEYQRANFPDADHVKAFPVIEEDVSDSGSFDNVLEFLTMNGVSLPEAVMMMIPQAWEKDESMDPQVRAMYQSFARRMEPWDGPASLTFTDGKVLGAVLDRNGLRPSRYAVTADGLVVMASEAGVLDLDPEETITKGRVQPGRMLLIDFVEGRIIPDEELKNGYAARSNFAAYAEAGVTVPPDLDPSGPERRPAHLRNLAQLFGYTREHIEKQLIPMAEKGKEPLGSMGNDTPLPFLSDRAKLAGDYFKQLFAQVTNPPIDSIRERVIMSLRTVLGREESPLNDGAPEGRRIELDSPIVSPGLMSWILRQESYSHAVIDTTFSADAGPGAFEARLEAIGDEAIAAVREGAIVLVLSDKSADSDRVPLGPLPACGRVHHALIHAGLRSQAGILVETGEAREVHHFCTLVGYGADAVYPYLAYALLRERAEDGEVTEDLRGYLKGAEAGMLKVMGKMGISTLAGYRGAQIFEAVGLGQDVIDLCFPGTPSRIGGIGLEQLAEEALARHTMAFDSLNAGGSLTSHGEFGVRYGQEGHMWDPEAIALLQMAVRQGSEEHFRQFANHQDNLARRRFTLRGLFDIAEGKELSLDEVEPAEHILRRFATGAMSYGSISKEAHEAIAVAMNRIGGKSNTGEGGEDPARWTPEPNGDSKRSAIKQIASGRFGVTIEYLTNADEIQIKMAQGAKPGEGGELPGHKVLPPIAKTRHSTPGVGLISPPPHHDIYSIEDLAQLIFDLRNANPKARISVKLVSEIGVGTIAAGVAKGKAHHILISGHDGGTGASPLTGVYHAGLPWELGIAETHQTLSLNAIRENVVLQADGQLKTGRDVIVAALLGADEYGFATSALISLGCVMMRKCHNNTCPVGVATQNPELRARFAGDPIHLERFLRYLAEDVRRHLARMGFRSLDEIIGRADLLNPARAVEGWKSRGIDLEPILFKPDEADYPTIRSARPELPEGILDALLVGRILPELAGGDAVALEATIGNTDRAAGTYLSHRLVSEYPDGLPAPVTVTYHGSAGQSFGAWAAGGLTLRLVGDANDYLGKGLSGGTLVLSRPQNAGFVAEENIALGNVAFYGAIRGKAFLNGQAGERFCVRNSGAEVVVEGIGDHGCEYMTGGRAIILGDIGRNFAAGMSGGIAYILDTTGRAASRINREIVHVSSPEEAELAYIYGMVRAHVLHTESALGGRILASWEEMAPRFLRVASPAYDAIVKTQLQEIAHGAS